MQAWGSRILAEGLLLLNRKLRPPWRLRGCGLRADAGLWVVTVEGGRAAVGSGRIAGRFRGSAAVRLPGRWGAGHPQARRRLLAALACAVGEVAVDSGAGLALADWSRPCGGRRSAGRCGW